MTDEKQDPTEPIDGMPRDKRGHWQPEEGTAPPNPLFSWPPRPKAALKWFFGWPGYLFPWQVLYMAVAILTWLYWQPALERCVEFRWDWMMEMLVRNVIMLTIITSLWHLRFWSLKTQGYRYKFTREWMAKGKGRFLGKSQLFDNVFWSLVSGGIIWTAYEVLFMWAYANEIIPYLDPREHPVYFVLLLCSIQLWRLFHFYWAHRLLHWPPLYKVSHYLHHKNINIGPWSGMAMHPIEHLLYFSGVLIHWVIPSHPIHVLFNTQHAAFTPAQGHVGFEAFEVNGQKSVPAGSYFHQLHHRYFECNYGEQEMPFDLWFGTCHDGSEEAHERMRIRRKKAHNI